MNTGLGNQIDCFPSTRYMGSKRQLLDAIQQTCSGLEFDTFVDLFAGSNVVAYTFKALGKRVVANDYLAMSHQMALALIQNSQTRLTENDLNYLLRCPTETDSFVTETFDGLYFTRSENEFIDRIRANIRDLPSPTKQAIALSALVRACIKKRPRGIFTYVGHRYDDGRRDLTTSLEEHFLNAVSAINRAVFSNGRRNLARHGDAMLMRRVESSLVYLDPPYYSPHSDNEYVRRYHFVEGLARDWNGVEIQWHTQTRKFRSYPTAFSSRDGAHDAFRRLFQRHRQSHILVSYSSNSLPTLDEIIELLGEVKQNVEVFPIEHRYSFGNQGHKAGNARNRVQEYLFLGY